MNRLCQVWIGLAVLVPSTGSLAAAPPGNFSAGSNPYFGSPGAYGPGHYSYPAPGVYGSTHFNPFGIAPLSSTVPTYNVTIPDEWPAVASARITVHLPDDARLWVDGKPTKKSGPVRDFVTPPVLQAGLTYRYTFRAEWTVNGQTMTKELPADVRATGSTDVNFATP
jgi:uncharacterized protein (TIGR03000 family)